MALSIECILCGWQTWATQGYEHSHLLASWGIDAHQAQIRTCWTLTERQALTDLHRDSRLFNGNSAYFLVSPPKQTNNHETTKNGKTEVKRGCCDIDSIYACIVSTYLLDPLFTGFNQLGTQKEIHLVLKGKPPGKPPTPIFLWFPLFARTRFPNSPVLFLFSPRPFSDLKRAPPRTPPPTLRLEPLEAGNAAGAAGGGGRLQPLRQPGAESGESSLRCPSRRREFKKLPRKLAPVVEWRGAGCPVRFLRILFRCLVGLVKLFFFETAKSCII